MSRWQCRRTPGITSLRAEGELRPGRVVLGDQPRCVEQSRATPVLTGGNATFPELVDEYLTRPGRVTDATRSSRTDVSERLDLRIYLVDADTDPPQ
jgi:hypothetical protein